MLVIEYETEFNRKLQFAQRFVPSEKDTINHFVNGLRRNIREFVTNRDVPSFTKAVENARKREHDLSLPDGSDVPEKRSRTLDSDRKESDEEVINSNKIKQELVDKIRKAENELNAERNVQRKKDDELLEAEKRFVAGRKLLEKEKDKIIEAEKRFDAERKVFESKIKTLKLNTSLLSKQISDSEQVFILERAKFDKEKKKFEEERLSKNSKLFDNIVQKKKALDEEKLSILLVSGLKLSILFVSLKAGR
ncbi:arginine and glutamate-rich protein 1-like [Cynara cardunculus var. scolymus]|uniref:arginine and glutamate-rich protein 1-like n=1 Tax=Cynara cardunculus var. scolymus TaxID=59895 RepID=UPI000D62E998|nr:arginine and glutamate-rich protein 1-like [Cynara cardunculus var. scolymus]